IEIAHTHHERHNGSGYPRALLDKDIPTFGKMAGIVDCYDAITSDRVYRSALTSHQALRQLYGQRGTDFQSAMVEQFIECIGIYPLGSLVELSTGEIGIVISQSRVRSLRPKVMLILNQDKESNKTSPIIDLMTQLSDYSGNPLEIKEVLEPGTYGINPKDFYL
ncbi:MAG: HD-GYP domain-containing protein, partial [Acidiferrobacterales bacterium]